MKENHSAHTTSIEKGGVDVSGWFLFFAQMLFFLLGAWYFLRSGSRRKGGRDGISMEENEREMEKLDAMRQVGLTEPLTEQTRPKSLGEIVGQERGIRALLFAAQIPNISLFTAHPA